MKAALSQSISLTATVLHPARALGYCLNQIKPILSWMWDMFSDSQPTKDQCSVFTEDQGKVRPFTCSVRLPKLQSVSSERQQDTLCLLLLLFNSVKVCVQVSIFLFGYMVLLGYVCYTLLCIWLCTCTCTMFKGDCQCLCMCAELAAGKIFRSCPIVTVLKHYTAKMNIFSCVC